MYELRHKGIFVRTFQSKEEAFQYIPSCRIETAYFGDVVNIYTSEDLQNDTPASYKLIKVNN